MKYKIYLLFITFICTFPLCGMNGNKKRKRSEQTLSQQLTIFKWQKTEQVVQPIEKAKQITIYHNISNIMLKYCSHDGQQNKASEHTLILTKKSIIPLKPSPSHQTVMHFTLPTAPENVRLFVENNNVKHGDSLYIHDEGKTIVIKNSTTTTELLRLPKQNSFSHIGQRKKGIQSSKTITIQNMNALFVTVEHIAQQEPLHLSNNPNATSIKESKLLTSQSFLLRKQEAITIRTTSSKDIPRIINSFMTLTIHGALQRIKIFPIDDIIQNNDVISISYENQDFLFCIQNKDNANLAYICTAKNYTEIN
jgi:hypothetical protein